MSSPKVSPFLIVSKDSFKWEDFLWKDTWIKRSCQWCKHVPNNSLSETIYHVWIQQFSPSFDWGKMIFLRRTQFISNFASFNVVFDSTLICDLLKSNVHLSNIFYGYRKTSEMNWKIQVWETLSHDYHEHSVGDGEKICHGTSKSRKQKKIIKKHVSFGNEDCMCTIKSWI